MVSVKAQKPTLVQREAMICFLGVFVVSLGLSAYSSLGGKVENVQFWFDNVKYLIAVFVGYLFGANMRIKT